MPVSPAPEGAWVSVRRRARVVRVLYGIQGEGRGHATRSARIVRALMERGHDVLVMTGGDALSVLDPRRFRLMEIPLLRYRFTARGAMSLWRTFAGNVVPLIQIGLRHSAAFRAAEEQARRFRPDVVISDFEPMACRLARSLHAPLVAVDHQHFLTETVLPPLRGLGSRLELWVYRFCTQLLSGWPRRIVVSSFHHFPKRRGSRAVFVGPFLPVDRESYPAADGAVVTVYLKHPRYLGGLLPVLAALGEQTFEIFSGWTTEQLAAERPGHIRLRPISPSGFLASLARSRALLTTAGNQVLGEAIAFGKPVLALPEADVVEQELNALALERSGCGMACAMHRFTPAVWGDFEARRAALLRGLELFWKRHPRYDGLDATLRVIERVARAAAKTRAAARRVPQPVWRPA